MGIIARFLILAKKFSERVGTIKLVSATTVAVPTIVQTFWLVYLRKNMAVYAAIYDKHPSVADTKQSSTARRQDGKLFLMQTEKHSPIQLT